LFNLSGESVMGTVGRRAFLGSAVGGLALGASGWSPSVAAQSLRTVRVTHFGGPYGALREIVADPFEKAGKGKVVYETENSVSATAKLLAQRSDPPFDVAMFSRGVTVRNGKAGLLVPLGAGDLSNASQLVDSAMAPSNFGAAMLLDGLDIMYDASKIAAPITSWLDLWRPDLKGLVAMPAAALPVYSVVMQVARIVAGDDRKDASIDAAFAKLKALRPNVRNFYSDPVQASQMIERGEVVAAVQYVGRISAVMKGNPNVKRATPKEGVPGVPYDLCVIANGRNKDVALQYIDFCLSPEVQSALATRLSITPSTRTAKVPAESSHLVVPSASIWFPDEDFAADKSAEWSRRWQREVQA
jgi:putative spermidine/putrescine transport system substrate-binding protein